MAIYDEIGRINQAKHAIKAAIIAKGVEVNDNSRIDEYAGYINNIQAGGSSEYKHPEFYEAKTSGGTDYTGLFAYHQRGVDLSTLDSSKVTNMDYMFAYYVVSNYGNETSKITNLKKLDFSNVLTTKNMFYYCYVKGSLDLSGISFPKLSVASRMFYTLNNIESIDLSNVDMPKLIHADGMFEGCGSKLTSINLTGINMPAVQDASKMFYGCKKITSLDLSSIDFSNATTIDAMFSDCKLLVDVIGEIDCSKIYNGLCYFSSYNPFYGCTSLETIYLKNIYKESTNIKNDSKWSLNLGETKVKDECLIYIINELPDLINDKGLTATDKIVLTLPPSNTLTEEQKQVARDKGWQVVN